MTMDGQMSCEQHALLKTNQKYWDERFQYMSNNTKIK